MKNHNHLLGLLKWGISLLFLTAIIISSAGCASIVSRAATADPDSAVAGCNASQVRITNVHWFKDKQGAWRVVGVIENHSSKAVSKLVTGVETRTSADRAADQGEDISAYPLNLEPGQKAPFTAWIDRDIPKLDHFEVEIAECVLAEPAERSQVDVRGGRVMVDAAGTAQVTAELNNPSSQTVLVNGLIAAVYDEAGVMITAQYADITPRYLSPGESGPVRASMDLPAAGISRVSSYRLFMDVLVNPPGPVPLDANRDVQLLSHYTDANGHFHQLGQITNPGDTGVMTSLQATLFGNKSKSEVADAAQMTTWVPLMPGETLPFDLTDWGPVNSSKGEISMDAVSLRIEPFLTWTTSASVKTLPTSDGQVTFKDQQALFTGKATNAGDTGITSGVVTAVVRQNSNRQIVAVGTAHLGITDSAAPGQVLDYSISVPLPNGMDPAGLTTEVIARGYQP